MLKITATLALVSALSGCVYRADLPPTASGSKGRTRAATNAVEPEKIASRPTQIGIRFYFKEPVPKDWSISQAPGGQMEPALTTLCLLTNQTTGSRVIFLLKSYLERNADPKAYQLRIMGDAAGWLETLPQEFGSPGLFGGDPSSGYVGVGTFDGMSDRWLVAAGRWRVADQPKMFADMQAVVATMAATTTASDKGIADAARQVCHDYY